MTGPPLRLGVFLFSGTLVRVRIAWSTRARPFSFGKFGDDAWPELCAPRKYTMEPGGLLRDERTACVRIVARPARWMHSDPSALHEQHVDVAAA